MAGVKHALSILNCSFTQVTKFITHAPYWLAFEDLAQGHKSNLRLYLPRARLTVKPVAAGIYVNSLLRMLILVNPTSPAGRVYNKDKLDHTCMNSFREIAESVLIVHRRFNQP
jgi:aspartate/methionine/tyrosine aminotransferase